MSTTQTKPSFAFEQVISDICDLSWSRLTEEECIDVAWAYYFFSIQFRENLEVALELFPTDEKLRSLEREECNTNNLSPWPGVAAADEKMNHDEFMKRLLELSPVSDETRQHFHAQGDRYLTQVRKMDKLTRALSIASYEDGGLERVFRAILKSPGSKNPLVSAFRHFLSEHIRFDSDPDQGHGAMIRHLRPDDRILPLWHGFKQMLIEFTPNLAPLSSF
jgi:hypothetical protein